MEVLAKTDHVECPGVMPVGAYVLMSGGIDSTACAVFYKEHDFSVQGIFVDYGQISAPREKLAATALSSYYRFPLTLLEWKGLKSKGGGLIQGRNAFLLMSCLMELQDENAILALGVHGGTQYMDCSPAFLRIMQEILDLYSQGRIQLGAPFAEWRKQEIVSFCRARAVPLELTYSCELGLDQPCGRCRSCRDLEMINVGS